MGRQGLSYEDFLTVVKEAEKNSEPITLTALRDKFRASPNTVHRYLTQYRQENKTPDFSQFNIPDALLRALATTIRDASESASTALNQEIKQINEEKDILEKEGSYLESENDRIQAENDSLKAINAQVVQQLAELKELVLTQSNQISELKNQNELLEKDQIRIQVLFDQAQKEAITHKAKYEEVVSDFEQCKIELAKVETRCEMEQKAGVSLKVEIDRMHSQFEMKDKLINDLCTTIQTPKAARPPSRPPKPAKVAKADDDTAPTQPDPLK